MSSKEVVVSDVNKKHKNPIAELVQVACRFDSNITLVSEDRRINAKSIISRRLTKLPQCEPNQATTVAGPKSFSQAYMSMNPTAPITARFDD